MELLDGSVEYGIEIFETNNSLEFRLVEVSFRIAIMAVMVEIGSSYRRLRIRIVEAIALKVKGMKNWYQLEKFWIIAVRITEVLLYLQKYVYGISAYRNMHH